MRFLVVTLGILAIIGGLAAIKFKQISGLIAMGKAMQAAGPPPEVVATAPVTEQDWENEISAVGTISAGRGVTVSNEVPGDVRAIEVHGSEPVVRGRMPQRERGDVAPQRVTQLGPARELHRVAVHEKERLFVFQHRTHATNGAARAEDLLLERELDAVVRVGQVRFQHVGQMMQVDDQIADARGVQRLDGPRDQRTVAQRHHRLGHRVRDRAQASAQARGEDHPFHAEGNCSGGKTMFSGRSARVRRCWR